MNLDIKNSVKIRISKEKKLGECFDVLGKFSEGVAPVAKNKNESLTFNYINFQNEQIFPYGFDDAKEFSEELASVAIYIDSQLFYGYIDIKGNLKIPYKFDYASNFNNGIALVCYKGLWGYINKSGKWLIKPKFQKATIFINGLAAVSDGTSNPYYINTLGKEVMDFPYQDISAFSCNMALVYSNNKYGFINDNFELAIPLIYDDAKSFNENLAAVKKDNKWGFINSNNKVVIPLIYDDVKSFNENLAAVKKDGKWGFINSNNKVVIPLIYDDVNDFNENLAAVKKDEKMFYINNHGKKVVIDGTEEKYIQFSEKSNYPNSKVIGYRTLIEISNSISDTSISIDSSSIDEHLEKMKALSANIIRKTVGETFCDELGIKEIQYKKC